jgi:hypothetical protein
MGRYAYAITIIVCKASVLESKGKKEGSMGWKAQFVFMDKKDKGVLVLSLFLSESRLPASLLYDYDVTQTWLINHLSRHTTGGFSSTFTTQHNAREQKQNRVVQNLTTICFLYKYHLTKTHTTSTISILISVTTANTLSLSLSLCNYVLNNIDKYT